MPTARMTPTRIAAIAGLLGWLTACDTGPHPIIVPGGSGVTISYDEHRARVAEVEELIQEEREVDALAKIREYLRDPSPDAIRRRLQALRREAREVMFYRQHPLHLTLQAEPSRARFGDEVTVFLRITNLGPERILLPSRHRSWGDALLLRAAERSVMFPRGGGDRLRRHGIDLGHPAHDRAAARARSEHRSGRQRAPLRDAAGRGRGAGHPPPDASLRAVPPRSSSRASAGTVATTRCSSRS